MFTYVDVMYAKTRYEEMLKEAEEQRRFAQAAAQGPNALQRAFATLVRALAPKQAQREAAQAPAMRKSLAAE
jgi:hypothetical protein